MWPAGAANKRKGGEGDEATIKKQAIAKAVASAKGGKDGHGNSLMMEPVSF